MSVWLVWGSVQSMKVQIGLAWPWSDCPRSPSKLVTNRSDIPQPGKGSSVSGPFLGRIYQQQQLGARKCPEPDSGLNTSICHLRTPLPPSSLPACFPYLGKHPNSCKVEPYDTKGAFTSERWLTLLADENDDLIQMIVKVPLSLNSDQRSNFWVVLSRVINWLQLHLLALFWVLTEVKCIDKPKFFNPHLFTPWDLSLPCSEH